MLTAAAVEKAKSTDGAKLRDTLESMATSRARPASTISPAGNHQGITENRCCSPGSSNGKVVVESERRANPRGIRPRSPTSKRSRHATGTSEALRPSICSSARRTGRVLGPQRRRKSR